MGLISLFTACEQDDTDNGIELGDVNVFVLCEGNFGSGNASLWRFDLETLAAEGPIYANLTGNALGDVGQSLTLYNDKLYIINNNSHTIEILELGDEITYAGTLALPNSSPREMTVLDGIGYVSCWQAYGIIAIDLSTNALIDTIDCGGMPEDIVACDDILFVALNMNADWTSADQVLQIDPVSGEITQSYTVVPGPGQIRLLDEKLYVASTYYDASWNTCVGISAIDLSAGTVASNDFGRSQGFIADLVLIGDSIYFVTSAGATLLNGNLSLADDSILGVSSAVYSAGSYEQYSFFGSTDYTAPDTVAVFDGAGQQLGEVVVGALPGDFVTYVKRGFTAR